MSDYIAHINERGDTQTLEKHLNETGKICSEFASKIGLANAGQLLGVLHDFGKYSKTFQIYLQSAEGKINPDEDDWVDAKQLKGKIDHSSAGAQYVYQALSQLAQNKGYGELVGQILALCIASHHSGLIDVIDLENLQTFVKRMQKSDEKTHLNECIDNANPKILSIVDALINVDLIKSVIALTWRFRDQFGTDCNTNNSEHSLKASKVSSRLQYDFHLGFLTRFLFSCLIDADRINSAEFEEPERKAVREARSGPVDWDKAITALERRLQSFDDKSHYVNKIRAEISEKCLKASSKPQGLYTLTVPTGGGKTYASLRYALHHAKAHNLDRIIYVIPYTSIIEQNAESIREVLASVPELKEWVLEHHSNLDPEKQTWHSKLTAENWDAPIVLTTSVQLLEAMFAGGTRSVRRLHQLSRAVLIFDEIQTLPIKCIHLFCNALNFLTHYCQTTAVLCTATQPGLNLLQRADRGLLDLSSENELIGEYQQYYEALQRVEVKDVCKSGGWQKDEIVDLALNQYRQEGSCLVIVNTKKWAKDLYQSCLQEVEAEAIFHLSTNLYPAHRKVLLKKIRDRLKNRLPVLCISTQLIEAGVDVDFASVIRFLAGLDSIAQAAGRCNRNGKLTDKQGEPRKGVVYVINPYQESTDLLLDIEIGKEKARSVLNAFNDGDPLSPEAIEQYFKQYYGKQSDEMTYRFGAKHLNQNVLDLLSNRQGCLVTTNRVGKAPLMRQAFMEAGKQFNVIDAPTQSVIIQHGRGAEIVVELLSIAMAFDAGRFYDLLKEAQQYSVNVFPNVWRQLQDEEAVSDIQGEGVYYLKEQYYSEDFGLSTEKQGVMSFLGG